MKKIINKLIIFYRRNKPTSIMAMTVYRFGNFIYYKIKLPIIRQILLLIYAILDIIFLKVICACEIPARCKIGKNFWLPHGTNGIIIHGNAIIGNNVTMLHQVTLGMKNMMLAELAPTIGDNVLIGAGAKILGNVKVSNNSKIGANCVVIKDVPENSTAAGIPARIS